MVGYTILIAAAMATLAVAFGQTVLEQLELEERNINCIGSYPAIFAFGDSTSDTGNGYLMGRPNGFRCALPPYGETFPGWPYLRFTDGHIILDLVAHHFGLPFLNPYQNTTADFTNGVNYAVMAANVLNATVLASLGILSANGAPSLREQISWHLTFKAELEKLEDTGGGKPSLDAMAQGLYIVFMAGGDFELPFLDGLSPSYINNTIKLVVMDEFRNDIEVIYSNGARNIMIFGIAPIGCLPKTLAYVTAALRDGNGCAQELNSIVESYNRALLQEIESLRRSNPDGKFIYVDLYNAYSYVQANAKEFGFTETHAACCAAGPAYPYNVNISVAICADPQAYVCRHPNGYVYWDAYHCTDHFNSALAIQILSNSSHYVNPPNALDTCSSSTTNKGTYSS